jgi:N-methylhydantoinase B/oxoprolinase/acetone carboxylase alpha subunit
MSYDPIHLEIFQNLFASVAEEMGVTLCRTAYSPNIKERRDYSCAVFDEQGRMIAQGTHIPVHLGAMPLSVLSAIENVPMEPGDVVILNDPYKGGTHLPDITLVSPVFMPGHTIPLFFVANRAHHADVGGMTPGSMPLSTEVFQEGIRIPPLKVMQRGEIVQDILSLILANVRTPEEREGDLSAQLAANKTGERRLLEIVAKYGHGETIHYAQELLHYAERMTRAAIDAIPDGTYTFADYMDNDGISAEPVPIRVAITINGSNATIDFSRSAEQVRGSVNAIYAITLSAVFYVFRTLVAMEIPSNHGGMVPLTVIAPEGTVVNATFPSAVAGGNVETSQRIVDVLFGAMAKALPDRIPAASSGTMNNVTIGGYDPRKKSRFTYYETIGGGMGARPTMPGIDGIHTHMTNTLNTPIEALEHAYPFRVLHYGIRRGSGGKGKFRGGDGIIREWEILVDSEVTILSERRTIPPYGLAGGESGQVGENVLHTKQGIKPLAAKVNIRVKQGDILRIATPGGGGYGKVVE